VLCSLVFLSRISRLESLLIATQMDTFCGQMDGFTAQSFSKLFLAGALQN
jgi:hypothetical protein